MGGRTCLGSAAEQDWTDGGLVRCAPTQVQVSLRSRSGSGDDGGRDDLGTGPQGWQWQAWYQPSTYVTLWTCSMGS